MKIRHLKYLCLVILLVVFGLWLFEGRHIHTKVGDFKIYKKDIDYRDKIIKLNYPEEKNSYGLLQLQRSYTNYQILRNYGYTPIEERLKTEAERIEQKTKAPDMLKKVKDIFGKDKKAYQRVFVVPAAVDEAIYYSFYNQAPIHKPAKEKADRLLEELKNSKEDFSKKAESEKLEYRIFQVSRFKGIVTVDTKTFKVLEREGLSQKPKEEDPNAKYWLETVLKDLNPGDIVTEIIELEDRWMVGKVLKKINKDTVQVEILEIPKMNFSLFVEEESKKIPVKTGFFIF